jgi:hypothetical protein
VVQTQAAQLDLMPTRDKFLHKLDRADLPPHTRVSLRTSITAICDGFDEDEDENKTQPNPQSFTRMLEFLSHPYHRIWRPPAITMDSDGLFAAIWQQMGVYRWILSFHPDGVFENLYMEVNADGKVSSSEERGHVGYTVHPPVSEANLA